jgi:hypothetical protein
MLGRRVAGARLAPRFPGGFELLAFLAASQRDVERIGGVGGPVGQRAKRGVVVEPPPLDGRIGGEQLPLLPQRGLLVMHAVQRIVVGEELLRIRLHHVPGRVADHRIEPRPLGREDVRELQLPMEEADLVRGRDDGIDRALTARKKRKGHRNRLLAQCVDRPEPDGTPLVHGAPQRLDGVAARDVLAVEVFLQLGLVNGNLVQGVVMLPRLFDDRCDCASRVAEQIASAAAHIETLAQILAQFTLDDAVARAPVADLLALEKRGDQVRFRPLVAVTRLALPGLGGILFDPIQPAADQRIADLDLVIQERERQVAIQRFDPQRDAGEFDRQRVDVHAVDAAFDHVTAQ